MAVVGSDVVLDEAGEAAEGAEAVQVGQQEASVDGPGHGRPDGDLGHDGEAEDVNTSAAVSARPGSVSRMTPSGRHEPLRAALRLK